MNEENRTCQNCKQAFVIGLDDFSFYEKIKVPPPTFCSRCRKQRRLAWRNDLNLYPRACGMCEKNVISIYSPESDLIIYCTQCWWSDKWNSKDYAQEYDFSKPFFVQFQELRKRVPILALMNDNGLLGGSVNCEYNQDFASSKNCYMVFIAWKLEECMYSYYMVAGKSLVDCLYVLEDNEFVYEGVFMNQCYRSKYIYYSGSLSDCAFCFDCRDCSDCFLSVGLRHKQYYFKNKQYTKEEYENILKEYRLDTLYGIERAKKELEELIYTKPRRFAILKNSPNSTGDYLSNCKKLRNSFFVSKAEDCSFVEGCDAPKESYDLSVGGESQFAYEGITPDHTYLGRFGIFSWKNTDYYYLDGVHSSEQVFGCVGLKKAQYCILNKQYTKEEYESMVEKIKKHMDDMPYVDAKDSEYKFGEFFPAELSYFGYNESVAQDNFPLSHDEAVEAGLSWRDAMPFTTGKETLQLNQLPDSIRDISENITKEVFACMECGRNYRIVPQELEFYKRMEIPIPHLCFFCRHKARLAFRNAANLYDRKCQCGGAQSENNIYQNTAAHFHGDTMCSQVFETSYDPNSRHIVYCEQCYQAEIS
jgi:hypothetical protein